MKTPVRSLRCRVLSSKEISLLLSPVLPGAVEDGSHSCIRKNQLVLSYYQKWLQGASIL
jgi:hypothetical protein